MDKVIGAQERDIPCRQVHAPQHNVQQSLVQHIERLLLWIWMDNAYKVLFVIWLHIRETNWHAEDRQTYNEEHT